jgi:hypothetical protein
MSKFLGEHADFKNALLLAGASTADSQPFALRDVQRVTIECAIAVTALDTAKQIAAAPASFTVVVGTAATAVSAMIALTSANLDLGETTAKEFNNWEVVQIIAGAGASARKADGRTVIIDGTTFTLQEAATIADKQIGSSANSVIVENFACAIATHCPHLEVFDVVTAADSSSIAYLSIRRKETGPGMAKSIDIKSTLASASTGCVYVAGVRKQGLIEFRPADVLATNSSYTHFGIRFKSTGLYNAAANVIRITGYQSENDNRQEV